MEVKNNKGLIIVIVVMAIIILGLSGFIVYDKLSNEKDGKVTEREQKEPKKEDVIPNTEQDILQEKYNSLFNTKMSLEELENKLDKSGTELAIVKNDVTKLLAFINNQVDFEQEDDFRASCMLLSEGPLINEIENGDNYLLDLEPIIMDCMYGVDPIMVTDDEDSAYAIISNDQYVKFNDYFEEVVALDKIDTKWEVPSDYEDGENYYNGLYEKIKPYLNQDYYYAYEMGDGYGFMGNIFELDRIEKDNDYYEIYLNLYTEDYDNTLGMLTKTSFLADDAKLKIVKYTALLKAEVVDNHIKYHELVINK